MLTRPSAEDSTAALHIITELSEAGHLAAMEWLGLLMIRHDRETAAAWLRRAQDAGSSDACWFLFHFIDRGSLVFDAEGLSGAIDRAEECHALSEEPQPGRDFAGRVVASVREQAAIGNEEAIVQLDSLESLGVFERHARLAIADAPTAEG